VSREIVITDSGCLISLERVDRLDILPALFSQVLLPPAVQAEFGVTLPWLRVVPPQDRGMVAALKMLVDEGEAEAIALAYELQYRLIIDDLQGRKVARDLGLQMTGTIGILVMAKQQGIIPALKPVIEALEGVSFYLSNALKAEALRLVGE
jgi:predicted nucleic acid-binding protein